MSTETRFIPLHDRQKGVTSEDVILDEHVAPHLVTPLWEWCRRRGLARTVSRVSPAVLSDRAMRMCIPLEVPTPRSPEDLEALARQEPDLLLEMADWLLNDEYSDEQMHMQIETVREQMQKYVEPVHMQAAVSPFFANAAEDLENILFHGKSAYTVGNPPNHLTKRVPRELVDEFKRTTSTDDAVSAHLRDAWIAAWRLNDPNVVEAYDQAVKALEGVLQPVVSPANRRSTLGTIIRDLRAKPDKWDTRFRGIETVEALTAMLDELWKTQVRHHKVEYLENTLEEAQDAVTIAVAVVSLCRRGFLERLNDYTAEEEAEDLAVADAALDRYRSGNMETVPYEEIVSDWAAETSSS